MKQPELARRMKDRRETYQATLHTQVMKLFQRSEGLDVGVFCDILSQRDWIRGGRKGEEEKGEEVRNRMNAQNQTRLPSLSSFFSLLMLGAETAG
jgi:hypothetical protein